MSTDALMEKVYPDAADDRFRRWMVVQGYFCVLKLPTGEWAGVYNFLYTWGLCVGLAHFPAYRTRFCYPKSEFSRDQVCDFLRQWDGEGMPPGLWLKQKPQDALHPDRPRQPWDKVAK